MYVVSILLVELNLAIFGEEQSLNILAIAILLNKLTCTLHEFPVGLGVVLWLVARENALGTTDGERFVVASIGSGWRIVLDGHVVSCGAIATARCRDLPDEGVGARCQIVGVVAVELSAATRSHLPFACAIGWRVRIQVDCAVAGEYGVTFVTQATSPSVVGTVVEDVNGVHTVAVVVRDPVEERVGSLLQANNQWVT